MIKECCICCKGDAHKNLNAHFALALSIARLLIAEKAMQKFLAVEK